MNYVIPSPQATAGFPRARPQGLLRARIGRFAALVRNALEASAQVRAHRHLLEFAERCEALQPDLAKELRMASARLLHG